MAWVTLHSLLNKQLDNLIPVEATFKFIAGIPEEEENEDANFFSALRLMPKKARKAFKEAHGQTMTLAQFCEQWNDLASAVAWDISGKGKLMHFSDELVGFSWKGKKILAFVCFCQLDLSDWFKTQNDKFLQQLCARVNNKQNFKTDLEAALNRTIPEISDE